jgi:hypothetical protein
VHIGFSAERGGRSRASVWRQVVVPSQSSGIVTTLATAGSVVAPWAPFIGRADVAPRTAVRYELVVAASSGWRGPPCRLRGERCSTPGEGEAIDPSELADEARIAVIPDPIPTSSRGEDHGKTSEILHLSKFGPDLFRATAVVQHLRPDGDDYANGASASAGDVGELDPHRVLLSVAAQE